MRRINRRNILHTGLFALGLQLNSAVLRAKAAPKQIQDPGQTRSQTQELSSDALELVRSNTGFAITLYQQLSYDAENLFFSPYSTFAALAMAYSGARGTTATEMANVLEFTLDQEEIHPAFAELRAILDAEPTENYQLNVVNRFWVQEDYTFLGSFLSIIRNYYDADLGTVDFKGDLETARQTINAWVDEQTNGKITDLFEPEILNALTRLVLVNAVYFKAQWKTPFNPEYTTEELFAIAPSQERLVPMMKSSNQAGRIAVLTDVTLIELPYTKGADDRQTAMVLVLPRQVDGLGDLEQQLTPSLLDEWLTTLDLTPTSPLSVWLPKFSIRSSFRLDEILAHLGMPSAFNLHANFAGIDGNPHNLYLQAVVHQTFVEVNEFGTEAAAATATIVGSRGAPDQVYIDHPFLFLIRDLSSNTVLFLGRVLNPLE